MLNCPDRQSCPIMKISDKTALFLLKISEFFIYFMPIIPIIVLLYSDKGVSVGEFFLIQGLFRLVSFVFEIPSGYLSDVFSRKKILLLGAIVHFLSMAWLIWAQGFWGVMLCEAGLGMASALFSGTEEAYAFDLLKRMKRENSYVKENGSIQTFAQTGTFIATLVGGAIYAISADLVMALEAVCALFGVLFVIALPELHEVKRAVAPESSPLKDCLSIVKMSVKHPEIKWLMLFPAMYGGFTIIMFWILQPMMESVLVPIALFGLFVGINQGSRAVLSKLSHRALDFFGSKKMLSLCVGLIAVGFASILVAISFSGATMSIIFAICAFVSIIPATQTMTSLVFKNYIHHRIQSNERGTILSIYSMFNTGIQGIMLILAKPILDNFGISVTVIIYLIMLILILVPMRKVFAIKGI